MRLHPAVQLSPAPPLGVRPTPPAAEARPKPARRGAARTAPRAAKGLDELDRVARRLEADWQTALRKHEAAVHRQFHDLRAAVRRRKALAPKTTGELRKALEPKLKPRKGRAKDLRRVESALDAALARLGR